MFTEKSVKEFLDITASKEPVPGGGAVAALVGASGAALASMMANLTLGKKNYEEVEEEVKTALESIEIIRHELMDYINKDAEAFNKYMEVIRMPKDTEEEKKIRSNKLQEVSKEAALVPLSIARKASEIFKFAEIIINKGNKNLLSDGIIAVIMARSAVLAALYNVKVNLGSIKDEAFVAELKKEVEKLEAKACECEKEILEKTASAF